MPHSQQSPAQEVVHPALTLQSCSLPSSIEYREGGDIEQTVQHCSALALPPGGVASLWNWMIFVWLFLKWSGTILGFRAIM